jgi:hypothetical protein
MVFYQIKKLKKLKNNVKYVWLKYLQMMLAI